MDDYTHFTIERDGEYLEHYGVKGMKWKEHNSKFEYRSDKYDIKGDRSSKRFKAGEKQEKVKGTYKNFAKGGITATKLENYHTGQDNKNAERSFLTSSKAGVKDIEKYHRSKYDNASASVEKEKKGKKKGKAASWVSGKAKDASVAYETGKARLKKLFGG